MLSQAWSTNCFVPYFIWKRFYNKTVSFRPMQSIEQKMDVSLTTEAITKIATRSHEKSISSLLRQKRGHRQQCDKFQPSPGETQRKRKPRSAIGLFKLLVSFRGSEFVFNHLVLSTFRQCRSAMPKRSAKPIASIHHTIQCPWRNPYVICIRAIV